MHYTHTHTLHQTHLLKDARAPGARRLLAKLLQAQRLAEALRGGDVAFDPLDGPVAARGVAAVARAPLRGGGGGGRGARVRRQGPMIPTAALK